MCVCVYVCVCVCVCDTRTGVGGEQVCDFIRRVHRNVPQECSDAYTNTREFVHVGPGVQIPCISVTCAPVSCAFTYLMY